MENVEVVADQIESILNRVISDASAVDPPPERYFLVGRPQTDDPWILGFAFKTHEDLRAALENGVCYQIHDYVFRAVGQAESLIGVETYIVFDFGDSSEGEAGQGELYEKFFGQLEALRQEHESEKFVTCGLCGHSVDEHMMMGFPKDGESAPTEGWMTCPNEECTCFRTWSLGDSQS